METLPLLPPIQELMCRKGSFTGVRQVINVLGLKRELAKHVADAVALPPMALWLWSCDL